MIANMTQSVTEHSKLILELSIDAFGLVTRKESELNRKDTLEGTLLVQIYPGIKIARVSVPTELDAYEQSLVESRMANLMYQGIHYKLAGASGAAKDGRFYFVDTTHAKDIAERFQHWPEAAMVYFSILISDCKTVIDDPNVTVLVVKDHVLGTNDCRGWLRESLYRKLQLPQDRFAQFRLAFDAREPKQAKGAVKAMSDRVADKLGVDIILPESSCKPELKGSGKFIPQAKTTGRLVQGPVILGIKHVSRRTVYGSSYTLVENASEEALRTEIIPPTVEEVRQVRKAWEDGDYSALLKLLGRNEEEEISFDDSFDTESFEGAAVTASQEGCDPSEAVLLADKSGSAIRIPFVANQLNRKLARWAFRAMTGGTLRLPAFALADDGVLIEHAGKIYSASDWIPKDSAITSLTSEQSLCVRYPIRMQEDLLPVRHLSDDDLVPRLAEALGRSDLSEGTVRHILRTQLRMHGAYILHSETAAKNGGDFDYDTICTIPSDRFPKFVQGRIAYGEHFTNPEKTKTKARSQWWNVHLVAMKARGNKIGSITDLKTSCVAAGRIDLAYQLVIQLQNALDSLKHKVSVDEELVREIRKQVNPSPWLRYKRERRVTDMPMHLEVADTDKVGRMYNVVRKELGDLEQEKSTMEDFRGLFTGHSVSKEMFRECELVNNVFGSVASKITEREEKLRLELNNAQAFWDAGRQSQDKEMRKSAVIARNKAQAAVWESEQDAKKQFRSLNLFMHFWAEGKQDGRAAWAQAMAHVVTNGKGTGAALFHTFPQEIVDAFAEQTGGESVLVRKPKTIDGYVEFDEEQRAYLVEIIPNPGAEDTKKAIFLFQYTGNRELVFEDTRVSPYRADLS
ncbi:MAG: hypothetical protein KGK08_01675 [Acidobacteriota bacterium]|nr:hypothetical protein [Acidobacteriota bacterium]